LREPETHHKLTHRLQIRTLDRRSEPIITVIQGRATTYSFHDNSAPQRRSSAEHERLTLSRRAGSDGIPRIQRSRTIASAERIEGEGHKAFGSARAPTRISGARAHAKPLSGTGLEVVKESDEHKHEEAEAEEEFMKGQGEREANKGEGERRKAEELAKAARRKASKRPEQLKPNLDTFEEEDEE
jgi:hypothetical protein